MHNHCKIRAAEIPLQLSIRAYNNLFPTMYFIGKYILVLDRDTFQLELDYRSIMHILVNVLSNQDSVRSQ